MLKLLEELAIGESYIERVQDESVGNHRSEIDQAEAATLDFTQPAEKVARQVRGLYPWPGCRVHSRPITNEIATSLTPVRAIPSLGTPGEGKGGGLSPGIITSTGTITCGSGEIEIIELQPEGKLPMPLAAYRNGHAWPAGSTIESVVK